MNVETGDGKDKDDGPHPPALRLRDGPAVVVYFVCWTVVCVPCRITVPSNGAIRIRSTCTGALCHKF